MSARRKLIAELSEDSMGGIATLQDVERAEKLVDAHRAEVLAEARATATSEQLIEDTRHPSDLAYNQAIDDVVTALAKLADSEPDATPLVVTRFDTAIEPAPEEPQVLTVGCIAEDGRPVALLLDVEDRAKVAGWLAPAGPDLHDTVLRALGTAKGPLLPLPIGVRRILAEHVTGAVAPLVPYREVWDASLPPGGRVCNLCGQPVESEPCPDHAPDFFQRGRIYRDGKGNEFQCLAASPHPRRGELTAIGWLIDRDETCLIFRMTAADWQCGTWTDTASEVTT